MYKISLENLAKYISGRYLYKMVTQKQVRTLGALPVICSVQGILLDREQSQI